MGNLFDPDQYQALWPSVAWKDRDLLLGLRSGAHRVVDLSHMTGIVSFPSYHAALPLILAWGVYPVRSLRLPAAVWAGLTISAAPLFGGHYVVDIMAGLMLAAVALGVAAQVSRTGEAAQGMLLRERCDTRPPSLADLHRLGSKRRAGVVHDLV